MIVATPAVAADQFDLICTPTKGGREVVRYRVDLSRGEWCAGPCYAVRKIASVTSGTLLLESEKTERRDRETQNQINRSDGRWVYYRADPNDLSSTLIQGRCEPAPFTDFPAAKF